MKIKLWMKVVPFCGLMSVLCLTQSAVYGQAARSYTTITSVKVTPLSNGVQISVRADGILQTEDADTNGKTMRISFPDARNGTGKNFFNVNAYPVSHIQLSTPQDAANGIGLEMQIVNFIGTRGQLSPTADGQGILLTIQSDRTLASKPGSAGSGSSPAASEKSGANSDQTSTKIEFANGLISLRAVRADIQGLMGAIAKQTGLMITVDDALERKVSLNLEGVTPEVAVRSIATAYGLALSQSAGIYSLTEGVPTDLATYQGSNTASFRMQNTQAQSVSSLLPNFLFSYVKVNPEQNAVVVTAPSQMLAKIGSDLQKLDVPSPQISIEAVAVELTNTNDLDLGLRFGNNPSDQYGSLDVGSGSLSYNTLGKLPRSFEASLRALELKGKARVRARPRMAVLNGRDANIFIGAQRFILTQFNQFGQTQTRIQPVDVGVKLRITPLTGGNGEITTRIAQEVSNITELDLQTQLPVLSSRRTETTVRVRDGETIAIGGLTLNQEQTRNGKIPFLGDLPLLGRLFHSKQRNTVQTELVVFITPHILTEADAKVAAPMAGAGK